MKKPTSYGVGLITLVSVLTPFASAQVNAAAQATMTHPVPPTAPNAAAISAQQAATASQRAADANSTVVAQSAAGNAAQSASVAQSPVNSGATALTTATAVTSPRTDATLTSGTAEAQANRPLVDEAQVEAHPGIATKSSAHVAEQSMNTGVESPIAADLNTAEITADIRNVSATTREALFRQIDLKIDTSTAALRAVRRNSVELRGEAHAAANESFKAVRFREQALRRSLKEARRASPDTAAAAQTKLAGDYQAYADAVVAAASTAHGSALPTNR